ncbi:MAG TPA: hypothetical protein VHD57_14275 [Vicinamibacterales bacterium]|jgi:hypothetical protein|nr:hypothetical protein [Vicinamibacterales bacterium]
MRPESSLLPIVVWSSARRRAVTAGLLALAVSLAGCTAAQRAGESPSYLIIDSLTAASGAKPQDFSNVLASDVLTYVKATGGGGQQVETPTIFADPAAVAFRLALKDPGSPDNPTTPSTTNAITVSRYHVDFERADGRNQPGVDVPYSFDGAFTATVTDSGASATFTLVRLQAKEEAPLKALVGEGGANTISTIAHVTFYGADQAGREVTVSGAIAVNFADWGDPE